LIVWGVTILILLIFVVLLWLAVLAPSAWRRFGERQSVGSVDNFHHQLQLLEHAGPKTVSPAYRLHTSLPGGGSEETPGPSVDSSRPKLVLLRPTDDEAAAVVDDSEGIHYERVCVLDRPEPVCLPEVGAHLSHFRRDQARNRCTVLLRCLGGVAISTGLIGVFPGMHLVWIFTVLSGVAALALVGLIGYAKEIEDQRERQRARRAEAQRFVDPAAAGYPGGWDEGYQERRVAEG
jgi:membrane protein implicated in regulation of membrane protease activity